MIIEIKEMGNTYIADMRDLPGSPPIGVGDTKERAIAALFFEIVRLPEEDWLQYIDFGKIEIIYV